MAKLAANYQQLSAELETILFELQQGELDIDQAVQHYERGLKLVTQLQSYIAAAENKVAKLQLNKDTTAET